MSIQREDDRRTRVWSYAIWGLGLLVFLAFELLGLARRGPLKGFIPWETLSETVWALERWWWPLRVGVALFLGDLILHFLFGTPLTPVP